MEKINPTNGPPSSSASDDTTKLDIQTKNTSEYSAQNESPADTSRNANNVKSLLNSESRIRRLSTEFDSDKNISVDETGVRLAILHELNVDESKFDTSDKEAFNQFVVIRLQKERQRVETLRQSNLDKLSEIIDKCMTSDKFNADSINKILDVVMERQNASAGKPDSLMSPMTKRRRMPSPQLPGTTRYYEHGGSNSDIHTINEDSSHPEAEQGQSGIPAYKLPPPPRNQWQSQYPNGSVQGPYMYQGSTNISGNLAPPVAMSGSEGYYEQQQQHPQQQKMIPHNYQAQMGMNKQYLEPPQFMPNYQQGYYNQGGRMIPSQPGMGEGGYQQMPQSGSQQHTPYRSQNLQMNSAAKIGHRRSHSAIVSMPVELRSPSRNVPQRPVNFLIHTPKHPPPT